MKWYEHSCFRIKEDWISQFSDRDTACMYEDFLRTDIRLTSNNFPHPVESFVGKFISGSHFFQVIECVDSSNPFDKQRNSSSKLLTLSDGVQLFLAFEFSPWLIGMHQLQPGAKILISGEPSCHIGVLHLLNSHITLLYSPPILQSS